MHKTRVPGSECVPRKLLKIESIDSNHTAHSNRPNGPKTNPLIHRLARNTQQLRRPLDGNARGNRAAFGRRPFGPRYLAGIPGAAPVVGAGFSECDPQCRIEGHVPA